MFQEQVVTLTVEELAAALVALLDAVEPFSGQRLVQQRGTIVVESEGKRVIALTYENGHWHTLSCAQVTHWPGRRS